MSNGLNQGIGALNSVIFDLDTRLADLKRPDERAKLLGIKRTAKELQVDLIMLRDEK